MDFFFFFFAREKAYTYQNHKYLGAPEIPWNFIMGSKTVI